MDSGQHMSLMSGQTPRRSLRRPLVFLALASFSAAAANRILDAILPGVAAGFDTTPGTVALIAMAYALAYGTCQLVFGPLGDRVGKYRVLIWACGASVLATALCSLAWSLPALAAARLLAGIAAGAIVPLAIAWVGDAVPDAERQPVLARFMSGQILGLLLGQTGGGLIGGMLGWRMAFVAIALVYACALIGLLTEARRNRSLLAPPLRPEGAVTGWRVFQDLARRPVVRFVLLAVAIEAFAMFGAITFIGTSLHERFGFGLAAAGGVLALYGVGGLAFVGLSRRLIGRYGATGMAARGAVLAGLAYLVMAVAWVPALFPPAIAVLGLGFYMLHNTLQTMATRMAPDARGAAVGVFAAVYFLGQALGVLLGGLVIDDHGTAPVFGVAGVILLGLAWIMGHHTPAELSTLR